MKFELSNFSDSHFDISVHFNMGNLTKEKQILFEYGGVRVKRDRVNQSKLL